MHRLFDVAALQAEDEAQGEGCREASTCRMAADVSSSVHELVVEQPRAPLDCELVFSSLPGDVARATEEAFARAGYPVISNSSAFRMDEDVPLLIPEINHEHLRLIERQQGNERGGFIVTNPNCSTIMLALALAPLHLRFGLEACVATTMQALSGAGYPGVASLDVVDNVLPFIAGEEEKIETETQKILGRYDDGRIAAADFKVSAQCTR